MEELTRILIVEDHPTTALGVRAVLADWSDIEVGEIVSDVEAAARAVESNTYDIVLCDISLHGSLAGFDLVAKYATRARPSFILYSAFSYPSFYARALDLGAAAYVSKAASPEELMAVIRTVAGGGSSFPTAALREARLRPKPPSSREVDVIAHVANGRSNDEIGVELLISTKTVESHLRRMFERYGLANRTELATLASTEGWIIPGGAGGQ